MLNRFSKKDSAANIEETETEDGNKIVAFRTEAKMSPEENFQMLKLIAERSDIPIYKGQVKHIYESAFTGYLDKCPLCSSPTERMMCNFSYGTLGEPRLATAPAGLFCPNCPTVIIDDDFMINSVVSRPRKYCGVFSVENGIDGFSLIETINGKIPTYILDENQTDVCGFVESVHFSEDQYLMDKNGKLIGRTFDKMHAANGGSKYNPQDLVNTIRKKKEKEKAKKKLAKKSKKANRK